MTHNYFYQIANSVQTFDTLKEARKVQKDIIRKDVHTCVLFRDNKGYYILKKYMDNRETKRIY